MEPFPAWQVAAGQFVFAEIDGTRTLCLKAERQGKDHVNHFLVPLDPLPPAAALSLRYLDPDQPLWPSAGYGFTFTPGQSGQAAVGDALALDDGQVWLKLHDAVSSQRLFCYVELASGQVRPRLERHRHQRQAWSIARI